MMINRMQNKNQFMNLVHKTAEGTQLWLGDYYAATKLPLLKEKSIKSVLTSAAMLGIVYPKEQQINHKVINAFDVPSYKMTPHFQEAFQFISSSLKKGNVLVHCAAGISRSTTFVIVYLMRAEGMEFKQAMEYVRSKRPIICPNDGFQKQLKRYEAIAKKLFAANSKAQKEEKMTQSQNIQEKQPILEISKQQKNENKEPKLTYPFGLSQNLPNKTVSSTTTNKNYTGLYRGNSLNSKKVSNVLELNPVLKQPKQEEKGKNEGKELNGKINKLTQQFLTFKLQNPKIVTIKK